MSQELTDRYKEEIEKAYDEAAAAFWNELPTEVKILMIEGTLDDGLVDLLDVLGVLVGSYEVQEFIQIQAGSMLRQAAGQK